MSARTPCRQDTLLAGHLAGLLTEHRAEESLRGWHRNEKQIGQWLFQREMLQLDVFSTVRKKPTLIEEQFRCRVAAEIV